MATKLERDIERINDLYSKFNIKVSSYTEGTRVNQYRLKIPYNIDIDKLFKLKKNLQAALEDNNIIMKQDRNELVIEAEGNGNILKMSDVFYKSMYKFDKRFRLVLGKDLENNSVTTLLPKAPHILVSGCTGSGKTQLLHCFIASLLIGSDSSILILIDPKGNEFDIYKDIDTVQFIDNAQDGISKLKWLVNEMNARYKVMAEKHATDISETSLSRIVCIIDEFADLMKTDKSIENYVVMLAQKARACGIHLIIGTQYPKVEIITGLIQANIPTRVCLKVMTSTQSKVALGITGGEKLLGHGDMLFLGNGSFEPVRIQAPFISKEDKNHVVDFSKKKFKGCADAFKANIKKQPESSTPTYKPTPPATNDNQPPRKKRVGLFRGLRNLLNSPQIVFTIHKNE